MSFNMLFNEDYICLWVPVREKLSDAGYGIFSTFNYVLADHLGISRQDYSSWARRDTSDEGPIDPEIRRTLEALAEPHGHTLWKVLQIRHKEKLKCSP
jgi:hypothetical protein